MQTVKPMGSWSKSVHTHEFELEFRNGRWFLVGIYYIDGKERVPSSLSDLGIVGCKSTAAVYFSPLS